MGAVADYLHESYLHEQIQILDEGVSSWLRTINPKTLIDKVDVATKKKDASQLESILKVIPKSDFKTLYKISSKINDNFTNAFAATKKEAKSKFPNLKGTKLDVVSLVFATTIVKKSDVKKAAKDIIFELDSKLKKAGVKNFGEAGMVGVAMLVLSGVLMAAAVAILNVAPLLVAIAIVGLAMIVLMR